MSFACIYIPNFVFQAAARSEPELRHQPVAPVVIVEGKALVVAANAAALEAGVAPGMTAIQAAPVAGVEIRPRAPAQERIAHAALLDLGFSFSPRVEDTAADTILLDLAGLENLLDSSEEAAGKMAVRAAALGLEANITVAPEIEPALQAARGLAGITIIPTGCSGGVPTAAWGCSGGVPTAAWGCSGGVPTAAWDGQGFGDEDIAATANCATDERLGSLPLEVLSPSVELLETLHRWGIRTLRALAALPTVQLAERLGQQGVSLQARARGTSWRPLVPAQPEQQFEEVMELEPPVEQRESLAFVLGLMLNRLCARLQARALALQELQLEMELDRSPEAEQVEVQSADPYGRYGKKLRLPVPTEHATTLLKLLQLHLSAHPPAGPVVKIRIHADAARPRSLQSGLFSPTAPDPEKLEVTLARIAKIAGEGNVGSPELVNTHRPGAFRMARFNPFGPFVGPGLAPALQRAINESNLIALRIFRPPLPAQVQTRDGRPVRMFFSGMRGEIVAASGPWRASGDWWREDWRREEWDVELKMRRRANGFEAGRAAVERALYRMYRDLGSGDWFVEANYD